MNKPKLELISLRKEYDDGRVLAVNDIDLQIEKGETVALLGSSGCGKSTILNMIVGLEPPTSGDIQIDGQSIKNTPAGKRNVGLVFQDYAIFSSMTVKKNLAFGLEVRGQSKMTINKAVDEVAELLDMKDKLKVKASELGGSELQRVAIGRTLVTKPDILLLDEPLSNLEAAARQNMRRELRRLQNEIGLTIIYVTHDQIEALSLADRIAVMNFGKISQVEKTNLICERPSNIFVAGFIGSPPMNLLKGEFLKTDEGVSFNGAGYAIPLCGAEGLKNIPRGLHTIGIGPDTIGLTPSEKSPLKGEIMLVEPMGSETVVTVSLGQKNLKMVLPSGTPCKKSIVTGLSLKPETLVFFNNETNQCVDIHFAEEVKR